MLQHKEMPKKKPEKPKGNKKPKVFPKSSTNTYSVLSQQISNIQTKSNNNKSILRSPILHFIIELSDSIGWKDVAFSIEKLGLTIIEFINEKTIRVSLNKEKYDNFVTVLERNWRYISNIKEISPEDKTESSLLLEIREKPNEKSLVSIEFSSANGLHDIDIFEKALIQWVDKENYGKLKRSYQSETTLLLSGLLVNRSIDIIVNQVEPLTYIAKLPELILEEIDDEIKIEDDYSLELNSFIPLDNNNSNITVNNIPVISIDSGINKNHTLLNSQLVDTYDYSTLSNGPCIDDAGHGSCVAGLAIFGNDLRKVSLPSAKVIAVKNFDAKERPIEKDIIFVIRDTINRFKYTSKIMNLSFSSRGPSPMLSKFLDKIIFDEDFVITTSTGNIKKSNIEYFLNSGIDYPDYINDNIMYFPADCDNTITVGGCTEFPSNFVPKNCPSPFTRSTFSEKIIKPEIMAPAGNLRRDNVGGSHRVSVDNGLGIFTSSNVASMQVERIGTSFSSPIVANIASSIMQKRFGLSAFLVKALLVSACTQMPDNKNSCNFSTAFQGFGKIEREYAINSLDWRVCYLLQGEFSNASPDVYHRYRFLFPDLADQISLTVAFGRSPSRFIGSADQYLRLRYKRAGVSGFSTSLNENGAIGTKKTCCYKKLVDIKRGGKGPWLIDIAPNFSKLPLYQRLKYGIVIVVSSSKRNNIYAPILNWVKPQKEELLVPIIQNS